MEKTGHKNRKINKYFVSLRRNKLYSFDMNKKYIITAAVLFALTIGGLLFYIVNQNKTIDELTETFALEKEDLENEYSQLAIQYEGYKLSVNNDSLEQKLEDQRIKIQRLVEELKQTKAQDARRIASLKKELETVRGVLRYYVAQVDSLNKVNEELIAENTQVKKEIQQVRNNNANLQNQNQQLTQKVTLAAQLNAVGVSAKALNKRNKKTTSLKNTTAFEVDFTIAANITAEVGFKDIFLRILTPQEDLLVNAKSGTFQFDGSSVQYSAKKNIEYGGEETPVAIFWNRNETLTPGTYQFELYADGNKIGSTTLSMEK